MSLLRVLAALAAIAGQHSVCRAASWLDEPHPAPWNKPGLALPAAPKLPDGVDPRCRAQARSPELEEDTRLHNLGWDLIGPYQGGWQILVIAANAGYDGMCRPARYQYFVFVRGAFVGTLSPNLMASRMDGALIKVSLVSVQGNQRLVAEYARYATTDPFCCPSATTRVVFEVAPDGSLVRPSIPFTFSN